MKFLFTVERDGEVSQLVLMSHEDLIREITSIFPGWELDLYAILAGGHTSAGRTYIYWRPLEK